MTPLNTDEILKQAVKILAIIAAPGGEFGDVVWSEGGDTGIPVNGFSGLTIGLVRGDGLTEFFEDGVGGFALEFGNEFDDTA